MSLPSLDVFIGLITIYIVLALTVSALTEIITRLVGLRSIGLKSGIRSILQDPNVKGLTDETKRFWNSGIIKSATDGDSSPNSLDALTFATATLATAGLDLSRNAGQANKMIANAPIDSHLKDVLTGLADRSLTRGTTLHDELAQHFDATMEKVGRWYRHWTQGIAFVLAIGFSVYVNANTLDLLHQLTAHPEARLELAKIQSSLPTDPAGHARAMSNLKDLDAIITSDAMSGTTLRPELATDPFRTIVGLLITILAVSLGAPFWFDVLGRISPKANSADRPPSSVSSQPTPETPSGKDKVS
ncbi:MAG TPA: hypothetical protein VGJ20_18990 [Xanthobacteraceae bacterium]|jgi:hypothetical protein